MFFPLCLPKNILQNIYKISYILTTGSHSLTEKTVRIKYCCFSLFGRRQAVTLLMLPALSQHQLQDIVKFN